MGRRIGSFEDLRVYQQACEMDLRIFKETKNWPPEERFALVDQIRRSSRAVGANLAEAWAKRRYKAHFVSKLTDADGEVQETIHWASRAVAYGYLPSATANEWRTMYKEVGGMLGRMIAYPEPFLIQDGA